MQYLRVQSRLVIFLTPTSMSTLTSIYLPTPATTEAALLSNPKSELQNILNGCATDLARYDAEIATARATLTRLESERQSLEDFRVKVVGVNASLHLDAPVYRLPTELLADILEITTRERYQQDHSPLYQLANGRLLELSTVCSRWHTVALGTPVLWTTIFVEIRGQSAPNLKSKDDFDERLQLEALLRAVLARSNTLPLQIHLDLRESYSWALAIYPLLVAESKRWTDAHLTLNTSTTILIGPLKNRLPILRRLTLEKASFHIHGLFDNAPSLTHVFVELASPLDSFPKLPVSQLRRLVVVLDRDYRHDPRNMDTLELASDLLEKCSEDCSVAILGLQVTEGGLTDPVVSRIKTLELSMNGLLPSALESWDMPCLDTLSIEGPTQPLVWSTSSFSAFAARSRSLTRLELKGIFISAHELASSLEHVPALCELSVADGDRNVGGITHLPATELDSFPN
uniref:F-box domain-containing protein n=1 Tax=Mycena chlorophos TaxID=658473 RepID=A0ABQ0LAX1_MYCCL|nr:predicted protein [Mycena chlorophos]